ncbi:metallophosphoesterase family protein [Sporosarcina sp. Marseille-Q4063]|uniref:metallophosphoesterase n=1 Tax=Sporosarcina sp. Marseille-Q4063 TaxID=2810514 RepID=UPI001BAFCF24|nr:metallophosphoesterase family protein [Sporosarcina sp. Marseille-Q4063]QUW22092.1 metallophosphoesterase family protein [Sporosarcina sp. Marseille-Q4063]
MLTNAFQRNVVHHKVTIKTRNNNKTKLKVFFISDIHRRKIDRKLIDKIDKDIDLIVIGGDLAEKGVPLSRIAANIRILSLLSQKIYYVWGNNDREAGEREIRNIMRRFRVIMLENENFSIPGHSSWGICGTDDPTSEKVDIEKTLRNIDDYEHILVICHQPRVLREIERRIRPSVATIMLAGHTHGGQIRIGKLGLLEKGSFQTNSKRTKLISNGYGTTTVPLRLGAPSECHVLTITY